MQADLFTDFYPSAPGFRRTDTSRAAADAVKPTVNERQAMVVEALRAWGPMTTVQVCDRLGFDYHQIQPRFSECRALGLIEDSGARGESRDKSKLAIVWRLANAKP